MAYNKETGLYEGYIYKITNNINKKIYIGQTRQSIERRWSQHITNSRLKQSHSLLDTAIKKYGSNNFTIECVEKVIDDTKQELIKHLNNLEKKYIKLFKASSKNGNYNITDGGEKISPTCLIPVDQYSLDGTYIKTYNGMIDVAYDLNISEQSFANISACCNGRKVTAYGYIWRYKGESFDKYRTKRKTTAKDLSIDFYDKFGNFIKHYEHHRDAISDGLVNTIQEIQRTCKRERDSCHGYVIRYAGDSFK